jgi:hypothetical protein
MMKVKIRLLIFKIFLLIFIELSTLGIYPQLNKQAFVRDLVDIINKDLHMVRIIIYCLYNFIFF